jgi:hypothetical protein
MASSQKAAILHGKNGNEAKLASLAMRGVAHVRQTVVLCSIPTPASTDSHDPYKEDTMQYRRLGNSNLQVSALCLGTMMFGDQTDEAEAGRIVASAREHGINFIDTADVYTKGASELMVGRLLVASATTGCWRPSSATR